MSDTTEELPIEANPEAIEANPEATDAVASDGASAVDAAETAPRIRPSAARSPGRPISTAGSAAVGAVAGASASIDIFTPIA